ncbi:MAG TPA: DUF371 domain-containing protein [Nitrososphaeraceae archaeon]|jgi:hypothetical protein
MLSPRHALEMPEDEIIFYGHPNVRCLHTRTIEVTTDSHLSPRGDCILGVKASKACKNLNEVLKRRIQDDHNRIKIEILVGNVTAIINGTGDKNLSLSSQTDIVMRKSNFISSRTLCINCDKASADMPEEMIGQLQDPSSKGLMKIISE